LTPSYGAVVFVSGIWAFGVGLSYTDKYFFWARGFGDSLHQRLSPKTICTGDLRHRSLDVQV